MEKIALPKPAVRFPSNPFLPSGPLMGGDGGAVSLTQHERGRRHSIDGFSPLVVILHIEDTHSIKQSTELIIKSINQKRPHPRFSYIHYTNGEEAFEYFKNHTVDIVLMDIDLQGGGRIWNGYQTAQKILELMPHQLIFSASSEESIVNSLIGDRPMFNGHLGKVGIAKFLREDAEGIVMDKKKKELNSKK